jgi:surface antigen
LVCSPELELLMVLDEMNTRHVFAALLVAALCAGCTNQAGKANKQAIFGGGGAVAGGLIGSTIGKGSGNAAAIIAGAMLGGLAGGAFGKSLDDDDLRMHQGAQLDALEHNRSGVASAWRNPDSGASGKIKPTRTFEQKGRYCREYMQSITVGGKAQTAYGTACRMPDGQWEIVSEHE